MPNLLINSNETEWAKININFLGSTYVAKKEPGAGNPYSGNENIYVKQTSKNEKAEINLTFSGPNILDIGTLSIKNITNSAKKILKDIISVMIDLKIEITVAIRGHSRGGIIAKNIYDFLKKKFGNRIKLEEVIYADPYAGPINRLKKLVDNFEIDQKLSNDMVIYSLVEKMFASPSLILNAEVVIFSNTTHSSARYVLEYVNNNKNQFRKKATYYIKDDGNISNLCKKADRERDFEKREKLENSIYKSIENGLNIIDDEKSCDEAIKYFKNYKTQRRSEILYRRLASINKQCKDVVIKHLKKRHNIILLRKIEPQT